MSQQDSPATCPYRGSLLDTRALAAAKLGCTNLSFVEPGAKINGQYYRDMLLMQRLLQRSATLLETGEVFVFLEDNAPAHRARDTIEFLHSQTLQFNSPDLNPVNYRIWGMLQGRVYRVPIRDTDKLRKHLVASCTRFQ